MSYWSRAGPRLLVNYFKSYSFCDPDWNTSPWSWWTCAADHATTECPGGGATARGVLLLLGSAPACVDKYQQPPPQQQQQQGYRVVWGAYWPLSCYSLHADPVNVNLSSFGIAVNGNGNGSISAEHGSALTMWSHNPHHRDGLGLYPYYSLSGTCKFPDPSTCNDANAVHGGVPQLGILNLSAHIAKLKSDINNPKGCATCGDYSLPADFDGLGVLDWESWSFTWSHMRLQGWTAKTDVRMNKSIELVLADHPHLSTAAAEVEAGKRWDAAVKIFIEATLVTLHELRPNGKFGVFGYPDCGPQSEYSAPGLPLACSSAFQAINDNELSWLWKASSSLFPGYYISAPPGQYPRANVTYASNRRGIDATVAEAVRVARSAPAGRRPQIFLYGRASYYSVGGFAGAAWAQNQSGLLEQTDLGSMVARPAAQGINGVVLLGSSEDCTSTKGGLSAAQKCDDQSEFIRSSLGPTASKAIAAADECAKKFCPQGGRCVTIDATGKDLEKPTCSANV